MPDPIADQPLEALLESLAAKTPTPGGGASAGLLGATAAATAGMVVAYSIGRKSLADHQSMLTDSQALLTRARSMFLLLADEDAAGYAELNRLMRLPEDDETRIAGWEKAVQGAIAPPRATLAAACDLLRHLRTLVGSTNPWLASDLAVAAIAAEACARAAAWNVNINLQNLGDEERSKLGAETDSLTGSARGIAAEIESGCRK